MRSMKRPRALLGFATAATSATILTSTTEVGGASAGAAAGHPRVGRRELLDDSLGRAASVVASAAAPSFDRDDDRDPHDRSQRRGEAVEVRGGAKGVQGGRERGGHAIRGRRRGPDADNIFAHGLNVGYGDSGSAPQSQGTQHSSNISPSLIGQPRIVGGLDANPTRYPYSVSLQKTSPASGMRQHVCGATLVAPDVLLSAAHCYDSFDTVLIGRYNLYSESDDADPDKNEVIRKIDTSAITIPAYSGLGGQIGEPWSVNETTVGGAAKHPLFTLTEKRFDISHDFMLIKLKGGPVNTGKYPPVKLNRDPAVPTANPTPETLTAIGWGTINNAGTVLSDVLREVDLYYEQNSVCENSEGPVTGDDGVTQIASYNGFIEDNMMCAFRENNDACLGDSGGPLLRLGARAVGGEGGGDAYSADDLQVGIVSFGVECARPEFPGIYSRVSDQSDWIDHVVCAMSDDPPADFRCVETDEPTSSPTVSPTSEPTAVPTTQPTDPPVTSDTTVVEGTRKRKKKAGNRGKKKPGDQQNKRKKKKKKKLKTPGPTSSAPTQMPTSLEPTFTPTLSPTVAPTFAPTTSGPSSQPSSGPTSTPTTPPTSSAAPSEAPTPEGGPVGATSVSIASVGGGGRPFNATPGCKRALYWDCDASPKTGSPARGRLGGAAAWTTMAVGAVLGAWLLLFP